MNNLEKYYGVFYFIYSVDVVYQNNFTQNNVDEGITKRGVAALYNVLLKKQEKIAIFLLIVWSRFFIVKTFLLFIFIVLNYSILLAKLILIFC